MKKNDSIRVGYALLIISALLINTFMANHASAQCAGVTVPSLIPNHDAEYYNSCPPGEDYVGNAVPWFRFGSRTSDYFNKCDFAYIPTFGPPPNPTLGNGYFGLYEWEVEDIPALTSQANLNYKEYIGVCLPTALVAGTNYKLEFYMAGSNNSTFLNNTTAFYGATNCINLGNAGCPSLHGYPYLLGEVNVVLSTTSWVQYSISFVAPANITGLAIGSGCASFPDMNIRNYYFLDNFTLNTTTAFLPPIAQAGSNQTISCTNASVALNGSAVNGVPPYTYSWTPTLGLSNPNIANPTATPNSTTNYNLTVTTANGCTSSDVATVTVNLSGSGSTWTWTGAASNNWFDGCNWDRGSVPGCNSNAIVPGGTPTNPEILGATAYCNTIQINAANGGHLYLKTSMGGLLKIKSNTGVCP